jgi:caa(3)-type oxidase subunit IV
MSEHGHVNYIKIWGILVGLLAVSVIGPMFGVQWLTLVTAFGIAVIKAYLVAKNFMHIDRVPKFIPYVMATCLVFMVLLFAGAAPDVMESEGANWRKLDESWQADSAHPDSRRHDSAHDSEAAEHH